MTQEPPQPQEDCHFFLGETPNGVFGITMPLQTADIAALNSRNRILSQALNLKSAENLIADIQAWLGADWDPCPVEQKALPPEFARVRTPQQPPLLDSNMINANDIRLHASFSSLVALSNAPSVPLREGLSGCLVTYVLELDHFLAPKGFDFARLCVGDCLLLPASFTPHWQGWLRGQSMTADNHFQIPIDINSQTQVRLVQKSKYSGCHEASLVTGLKDDGSKQKIRVVVSSPHPSSECFFHELLPSWRQANDAPLLPDLTYLDIDVYLDQHFLGKGHLLPISQGWGVQLQGIQPPQTPPSPQSL
jgi:hypothetical protein